MLIKLNGVRYIGFILAIGHPCSLTSRHQP